MEDGIARMGRPFVDLPDLLAVEHQILRDHAALDSDLRERDRRIGRRLGPAGDAARLSAWAREMNPSSGTRRAFRAASFLLVLAGLVLGAGASIGLLSLDAGRPINVFHFLVWMVGLQILLLVVLALLLLPPRLTRWIPLDFCHDVLRRVLVRIAPEETGRAQARLARLEPAIRWALLARTQAFGVAFNLGVLTAALLLVTFSDRQFCWSTTLQLKNAFFHGLVDAVATPWKALLPAAAPTPELVDLTRYSTTDGAYLHPGAGPKLAGGWWPFLLMAVAVYGLLPRTLVLAVAARGLRVALTRLPLRDDAEYSRILERLETDLPGFAAGPAGPGPDAPAAALPPGPLPGRGLSCSLVIWEGVDVPDSAIETRFGWRVGRRFKPGDPPAVGEGPVVLAPPPWEDPTTSYRRVVRAWREAVGPDRLILVFLAHPGRRAIWDQVLRRWGDPSLRVEAAG